MFDLEQAITTWRKQLATAGIKPADLAELESHLRDHVHEELRSGLTPERAFATATTALGQANVLGREFTSATRIKGPKELILLTFCTTCIAAVLFLGGTAAFVCYTNPVDRVVLTLAVLATVAVAVMGRRLAGFVPAIPLFKPRLLALLTPAAVLFGLATFYCQVVVPHFPGPGEGFLPALGYFTMVPIALGCWCFITGLEQAVDQTSTQAT